jgi:hypothetical protein
MGRIKQLVRVIFLINSWCLPSHDLRPEIGVEPQGAPLVTMPTEDDALADANHTAPRPFGLAPAPVG